MNENYILFEERGKIKGTSERNYNSPILNERQVQIFSDFETYEEVIDYCVKYMHLNRNNIKIADNL